MSLYLAIARQIFGRGYRKVLNTLYISLILYFSLHLSGLRLGIAPRILFFTAFAFTGGILWESLSSRKTARDFEGLFALPTPPRQLSLAWACAFSAHTLLLRTLPVLALLFALNDWALHQILLALLLAMAACLHVSAWFVLWHERPVLGRILALPWGAGAIAAILTLGTGREGLLAALMGLSLLLAIAQLLVSDGYVFYQTERSRTHRQKRYQRASVFRYLFRVLGSNPSYLANSLFLTFFALLYPHLMEQLKDLYVLPIGLAIFCLNTPLCTMISQDKDTRAQLIALPGEGAVFLKGYVGFIFCVNLSLDLLYLLSWQLTQGGVGPRDILLALLFSLQGALFSVYLEARHPVLDWRVETELWHHPRKYLVPGILIVIAAVVMIFPPIRFLWAGILLGEVLFAAHILL